MDGPRSTGGCKLMRGEEPVPATIDQKRWPGESGADQFQYCRDWPNVTNPRGEDDTEGCCWKWQDD